MNINNSFDKAIKRINTKRNIPHEPLVDMPQILNQNHAPHLFASSLLESSHFLDCSSRASSEY
jgi:hypothetical protein